jgi:hypothetical protein
MAFLAISHVRGWFGVSDGGLTYPNQLNLQAEVSLSARSEAKEKAYLVIQSQD